MRDYSPSVEPRGGRRHDPKASPDGLRGSEGTFSLCSGWYVDALTRSGRLEEARLTLSLINAAINLDHQLDLDRARRAA